MTDNKPLATNHKSGKNKATIFFALTALLDQVLVCLIYGLLYDFSSEISDAPSNDAYMLVAIMTIMVVVGTFGFI